MRKEEKTIEILKKIRNHKQYFIEAGEKKIILKVHILDPSQAIFKDWRVKKMTWIQNFNTFSYAPINLTKLNNKTLQPWWCSDVRRLGKLGGERKRNFVVCAIKSWRKLVKLAIRLLMSGFLSWIRKGVRARVLDKQRLDNKTVGTNKKTLN